MKAARICSALIVSGIQYRSSALEQQKKIPPNPNFRLVVLLLYLLQPLFTPSSSYSSAVLDHLAILMLPDLNARSSFLHSIAL
eukprot:762155-Hanusia_phi.AAC.2